jgi:pilus assembly protein CpaB
MALRFPRLRINRLWFVLGAAVLMGSLAAWLSAGYLKNKEKSIETELAERAKGGPTIAVVVPISNLSKGAVLTGSLVAGRDVQADLLYEDAVTAEHFKEYEGRRLLRPILQGRPLRRGDVFDDRPKDLASELVHGRRALTIDIDENNSFAQMLRPGNYVDLYLIATNPKPGNTAVSQEIRPLLNKVRILATGPMLQGGERAEPQFGKEPPPVNYANITVDVTPQDSARIALATQVGKIRAVLRNPEDEKPAKLEQMFTSELFESTGNKKSRSVDYIVGGTGAGGNTQPNAVSAGAAPAGAGSTLSLPGGMTLSGLNIPGMPAMPATPGGAAPQAPAAAITNR